MAGKVSTWCLDLVSMWPGRLGSTSHPLHPWPGDQVGFGCKGQVFNALCINIQHEERKWNVCVHLFLCLFLSSPCHEFPLELQAQKTIFQLWDSSYANGQGSTRGYCPFPITSLTSLLLPCRGGGDGRKQAEYPLLKSDSRRGRWPDQLVPG